MEYSIRYTTTSRIQNSIRRFADIISDSMIRCQDILESVCPRNMFNPICTSLRAVQQASKLKKVQCKPGCPRASLGSLSESILLRGRSDSCVGSTMDRTPDCIRGYSDWTPPESEQRGNSSIPLEPLRFHNRDGCATSGWIVRRGRFRNIPHAKARRRKENHF